jgi:hypothetical protein
MKAASFCIPLYTLDTTVYIREAGCYPYSNQWTLIASFQTGGATPNILSRSRALYARKDRTQITAGRFGASRLYEQLLPNEIGMTL